METLKFWSRVDKWFKRSVRPMEHGTSDAAGRPLGIESRTVPDTPNSTKSIANDQRTSPVTKFRWSRSASSLERLEEEYTRVVKLMDAIQQHLGSQAERSERTAHSLDRLAEIMEGHTEVSQKQLDLLSTLASAVDSETACAKRIEESLSQWPQIADAQRETMVSIARQLDVSREASERVTATMEECRQTFTRLEEVTDASTKVTEQFASDASAGNERLAAVLQEQSKRFSLFAWSVIGLAGVGLVTGLIALFR